MTSGYKFMANFPTSHFDIFDYWKDKCIDKYGNVYDNVPDNFDKNGGTVEIVVDWGEPNCWCCNKIIPAENEVGYEKWLDACDYKSIWNSKISRSKLQRAHIKPQMLGGSNDPSNLFLLCKDCHKESPDIDNKEMFLSYIFDVRKNGRRNPIIEAVNILQERYGYNLRFPLTHFLNSDRIKIGQHGGSFSHNSFVYKFVLCTLMSKTKLRGDIEIMFYDYLDSQIAECKEKIKVATKKEEKDKLISALEVYEDILNIYERMKSIEFKGA